MYILSLSLNNNETHKKAEGICSRNRKRAIDSSRAFEPVSSAQATSGMELILHVFEVDEDEPARSGLESSSFSVIQLIKTNSRITN